MTMTIRTNSLILIYIQCVFFGGFRGTFNGSQRGLVVSGGLGKGISRGSPQELEYLELVLRPMRSDENVESVIGAGANLQS